ncbi:ATP-binding protein [Pseudonocardia sp. GCM10023141]|uniref:ATP-binding protein n=1 Tax=Pseudonocardia sp. GCM10023141 TaxID=3252653 RepID=UPI00360E0275
MEPRFVGRATELEEVADQLEDALAARPRIVLVSGEAGIGKTRLVAELCRLAGARAVPAWWGGCSEDAGAPAYWPWRRILRSWLAAAAPGEVARMAAVAGELARIAPELGPAPAEPAGPEQRFVLFDAAARFFTEAAAAGGLVLVIDDAQWADPASLALLAHLGREVRAARLLLVVTYRDVALGDNPLLAEVVSDLARSPGTIGLELAGLDDGAVASALAERIGARPSPQVVAAVARRTRGNPFFVGELGRVLGADAATVRVPGAVRDVVRRRLARLPDGCRDVLAVAAVLGRELDLAVLTAAAELPVDTVLDLLQPAHDDGVLDRPLGRTGLRFAHDLVRETVLDDLAPGQRARIHQRAADSLRASADDPDVLPELAHHALAALPLGDAAAAVGWARQAAENAMTALAHEDAARLFVRAVDAGRTVLPPVARADLLVVAAHAQAVANNIESAIELGTEAVALARRIGDPALVGRAALVMPGVSDLAWLHLCRDWCEEALRGTPDADSAQRAQLLAQLSHTMLATAGNVGLDETSARALAMAERVGDAVALASALRARQLASAGAEGNAERLVVGGRMLALGVDTGDPDTTMWGHLWRFDAVLQAGRVDEAEAELDLLAPVVARLRLPLARLHLLRGRAALAMGRGQYVDAARFNDEALGIATDGRHEGALMTARVVRHHFAAFTGDAGESIDWLETYAAQDLPWVFLLRASLGLWHLALGRRDDAERWYAALPPPGTPRAPAFMALVLETSRSALATDLGDPVAAEMVHRLLLPHAHLHSVGGAGAITTGGSVQLYLGIAALGAGKPDVAVRHLRVAITVNDACGLVPFAGMARFRLAAALRARGRAGDVDEAVAMLNDAGAIAARLGMAPLQAQVAALGATLRAGGVLSRREREIADLVAGGLTNRQVAATTHISERTVESHVQHILSKLGFTSRSQIAVWAARRTP